MHKITIPFFSIFVLSSLLLILTTFDISFFQTNASSESNEIIQIPSKPTDFPGNSQDNLEILFSKATRSSSGDVHVIGSIENTGQNTLRYVDVTAHFFDENNKTIGVTTCCYADPSDIEAGHTSSFDSFSSIEAKWSVNLNTIDYHLIGKMMDLNPIQQKPKAIRLAGI